MWFEATTNAGHTLTYCPSRWVHGGSVVINKRGDVLRSVENYTADSKRDPSRSHYTINGRKVSRGRWRRAGGIG